MTSVLTNAEVVAVRRALEGAGSKVAGDLSASLISGGRSNLTVLLADERSRWVLRTPPRHGRTPSAHDVGREFKVTGGLLSTEVPVARSVVFVEDESLLGGPFAIWEFVEGQTLQSRSQLEALDATTIDSVTTALIDGLAALHRVDYVAAGLGRFGRPDAYVERQIARWSKQWEHVAPSNGEARWLAGEAQARLAASIPKQRYSAIVHGDYRIDNALLRLPGDGRAEVAAIVDWELATIGDPVADVATMCAYRHQAFDMVLGFETAWASKLLDEGSVLASRYEAAGGVRLHDWETYLALAYFKIAVIAAGIDYRWRAEGRPSDGNRTAGEAVEPFLHAALALLNPARPR